MTINLLSKLYNFVIITSRIFNIDESHSISHSMNVHYYANKIYNYELMNKVNNTNLEKHKNIIDVSSILHDMCDKKYMDEKVGIENIDNFIKTELKEEINNEELEIIKKIILTMSYSTVKKNGFPNLNEYQLAYNVVREADLLTSYDFDRCIIYKMMKNNENYEESFNDALKVYGDDFMRLNCERERLLRLRNSSTDTIDWFTFHLELQETQDHRLPIERKAEA